jgi:hypothetical protein
LYLKRFLHFRRKCKKRLRYKKASWSPQATILKDRDVQRNEAITPMQKKEMHHAVASLKIPGDEHDQEKQLLKSLPCRPLVMLTGSSCDILMLLWPG